jgi:hypothetical protein
LPEFIHDLLSTKNIPKLAAPLAESAYVHPRVHGLWNRLATRLQLDEADDIASEPTSNHTVADDNDNTDPSEKKRSKSRKGTSTSTSSTGSGNGAIERATAKWQRFWITLVDDNLFGSDSYGKKYLGFQLVELFLNRFTSPATPSSTSTASTTSTSTSSTPLSPSTVSRIRTMFSPRFFRVFMNHLPTPKRTLNKSAIQLVSSSSQHSIHDMMTYAAPQ